MDLSKGFLLALVGVLLALSILMVLPFLQYFLLAVVLAYVLAPLQARVAPRVGRKVGAGLLVVGATIAIIAPLVLFTRFVAREAAAVTESLQNPRDVFNQLERDLEAGLGLDVDLVGQLQDAVSGLGTETVNQALGLFGVVTHTAIGLGLTLFLLYYFLKDGRRFIAWLREVTPLQDRVLDDLFAAIDNVTWAVLAGHVFVAVSQGVIAGIGLFVAGVPNAIFWTATMVVLSLLPIVGSFLVWGPASFYLLFVGNPIAGAALFVYGLIVVGVSDDYLRPIIVDRYAAVNPSVIIIGVLGGIYAFGFMGLFFGPIIIGALRATIDVFRNEYRADYF